MDHNYVNRWILHAIRYISVAVLQYDPWKLPVTYKALRDDRESFRVAKLLKTPLVGTRATRLRFSAAA